MTDQTTAELNRRTVLPAGPGVSRRMRRAETALAIGVAVMAMLAIWLVFRPIGDLYVALAAGRDVVQGKLGELDEWSFTAADRVWINQNWGTHLMYYLSYVWGGEWGLLGVKAGLIVLLGVGVALACRARRVSWPVGWVMAGAVLLSGQAFIDQRPNLTSLALDPIFLWLLYRTRNHPQRIWWGMGLIALWANMHGGFFFAIGMIGLWTLCHLVAGAIKRGPRESLKQYWPMIAATAAAIVSAAVLTPFNVFHAMGSDTFWRDWNLTHPLIMRSDVWREVREWRPVFDVDRIRYGSAWEFCAILGVFGAAGLTRLYTVLKRGRKVRPKHLYTAVLLLMVFSLIALITVHAYSTPEFSSRAVTRKYGVNVPDMVKNIRLLAVLVLAGSLIVTAGAAVMGAILFGRARTSEDYKSADAGRLGMWTFDVLLSMLVVYMAFTARRFIPLAVIMLSPLVARQLNWVCSLRFGRMDRVQVVALAVGIPVAVLSLAAILTVGSTALFMLAGVVFGVHWLMQALQRAPFRVCPPAVLAVAVGVLGWQLAYSNARYYHPSNPMASVETLYERMVGQQKQPTRLTQFIRENDVSGRVLHEWRWEGYLHWRCPELKLLLGGRAQQIYDEEDYHTGMGLRYGQDLRTTAGRADPYYTRRGLKQLDVHLVAAPTDPGWRPILQRLLHGDPHSRWTYLYRDGRDALLADTRDPAKRIKVTRALRGELKYPSRAIEALTQASILLTPVGQDLAAPLAKAGKAPAPTNDQAFRLLIESIRLDPTQEAAVNVRNLLPSLVDDLRNVNAEADQTGDTRPGDQRLIEYIAMVERALAALREMPVKTWGGLDVLTVRVHLNHVLGDLYSYAGQRNRAVKASRRIKQIKATINRMSKRWS